MIRFVDHEEGKYPTRMTLYEPKVLILDLEALASSGCQFHVIRELIDSDYDRVCKRVHVRLPSFEVETVRFSEASEARICIVDRSGWISKSINIARVTYKSADYNLTIKDRRYSEQHYVVSHRDQIDRKSVV